MRNSADFVIRPAKPDDYAPACAVLDELDRLHWERLPWLLRKPPEPPRSVEFFASQIAGPKSTVLVAEAETIIGVAIGFLRAAPEFGVFVPQQWAVLDAIGVSAAWRRHGVGRALALAFEAWAFARDAQWLELGVYEFNVEARRFYEQLGYLPLSTKLRKPR